MPSRSLRAVFAGAFVFLLSIVASASIGIPTSTAVGPATITSNTIHITGIGTVVVRAEQAGNPLWNAAPPVEQAFTVGYGVATLFDATRAVKAGSTLPVKVRLTDAAGSNLSSASLVVTAIRLDCCPRPRARMSRTRATRIPMATSASTRLSVQAAATSST
jgi:hypothetical protein